MKRLTNATFDIERIVHFYIKTFVHFDIDIYTMSLECLISLCNALKTTPDNILLGEYELSSDSTSKIFKTIESALTSDENRFLIEIATVLDKLKINRS